MWGQSITCHNLHHPSPLATLVGIAGRLRLGEPEPTTGRMLHRLPVSKSGTKGWPTGMDFCCQVWCIVMHMGTWYAHWHAHGQLLHTCVLYWYLVL